jgi:hypothetical protein
MEIEKVNELEKVALCFWYPEKACSHQWVSAPGKSWKKDIERVRNIFCIEQKNPRGK